MLGYIEINLEHVYKLNRSSNFWVQEFLSCLYHFSWAECWQTWPQEARIKFQSIGFHINALGFMLRLESIGFFLMHTKSTKPSLACIF
jgi:hypothetical protein